MTYRQKPVGHITYTTMCSVHKQMQQATWSLVYIELKYHSCCIKPVQSTCGPTLPNNAEFKLILTTFKDDLPAATGRSKVAITSRVSKSVRTVNFINHR